MNRKIVFTVSAAVFCYQLARKFYLMGFDAGYDTGIDRAEKPEMTDDEFIEYHKTKLRSN